MTDSSDTSRLLERLADTFADRPAPLPELVAAAHAGRRRRGRRNLALAAGACVLAVGAGAALVQVLPDDWTDRSGRVADSPGVCERDVPRTSPASPVPQGPGFPTNAAGQTYGSGATHRPDLVAVIGDCGRMGYARATDLDDPPPWVPGAGSSDASVMPVFESDGVTQVDTFTRDPGAARSLDDLQSASTETPAPTGPDAADIEGGWTAVIAGVTYPNGKEQYDTFRDLDLAITFGVDRVEVYDGCTTWSAGYTLVDAAFALTSPWVDASGAACDRAAPLTAVLDNVRYVSREKKRTYLNLENHMIVVVLTRP